MKLGTLVGSLAMLGTACAVVPDEANEGPLMRVETLKNVAIVDPRGAAVCSTGEPCGASQCKSGEFCCNASCGICAPLGGSCIQLQCEEELPPRTQCVDSADCRAISNYCNGCQCLAAGFLDPDPSCHAPMVACFVDPCHHRHSECITGLCTLVDN